MLRGQATGERGFVILGRERNVVLARPGSTPGLGYPTQAIRQGDLQGGGFRDKGGIGDQIGPTVGLAGEVEELFGRSSESVERRQQRCSEK